MEDNNELNKYRICSAHKKWFRKLENTMLEIYWLERLMIKKQLSLAMIFDMDQMAARVGDPEFAKLIENDVESHDFYVLQEMKPPSE